MENFNKESVIPVVENCIQVLSEYLKYDEYVAETTKSGSVQINSYYYRIQALIACKNLVADNNHILALPKINDLFVDIVENTKIDMMSETYEEDFAYIAKFVKYYRTGPKAILADLMQHINIEDIKFAAAYAKIMQEHTKWFNVSTYLNVGKFRKPTNIAYSSKIFISKNPAQWLQSCYNKATEMTNFDDCFVSMFAKIDNVDSNFSYFNFSLIMNGIVYIIDDSIKFQSINKKFYTRRPERSREMYYDNLYLPYDILFEQDQHKFTKSEISTTDVILFKEHDETQEKLDVFEFSSIQDRHKDFIYYMINFYIENGETLFQDTKAISMSSDYNQLLLPESSESIVETKSYDVDWHAAYAIADILKQTGQSNSMDLQTTITTEVLEKSDYYDKYQLCTKELNDALISWIARKNAVSAIYRNIAIHIEANEQLRRNDSDRRFFQNIYDQDRMKFLKRVFGSKDIFVNRDSIKQFKYWGKKHEDSLFVIKNKNRFVYSYEQAKERLSFVYSDILLAKTTDYSYQKEDCECHHCLLTNQKRIYPANTHAYVLTAHYKEIMWLFDLKRDELPKSMQIFQGASNFNIETGNSILNDIDPVTKLLNLRHTYADSYRTRSYIKFDFGLCARCAKWLQKSTSNNQEIIIDDIDYDIVEDKYVTGGQEEFIEKAKEYNEAMGEHYEHNIVKFEHWTVKPKSNK